MGLWWKDVGETLPVDEEKYVVFPADPEALGKEWLLAWRFFQNWHILAVASDDPYWIFFKSASGRTMQYRRLISSKHVAVRVGPEEVTFFAMNWRGRNLKIASMNIMIPGLFRPDRRDIRHREEATELKRDTVFV